MKKVISMIMAFAILALAAIAYAEESPQETAANGIQVSEHTQNGPMTGGPNRGNRPNDRPPQMPGANGQNPQGQAPRMPSGNQNGNRQNGQPPERPDGEAPVMIDFDAMVTKGVISQDTCDKIKAYMEQHKPADLPNSQPPAGAPDMTEEKSAEDQTVQEKPDGGKPADTPEMEGGLLADLLKEGIITQAEYGALTAAQTAETT